MKLNTELTKLGATPRSAAQSAPCGTLSSNTMMVMMMAMTPSLNAARRSLPIQVTLIGSGLMPAVRAGLAQLILLPVFGVVFHDAPSQLLDDGLPRRDILAARQFRH